MTDQRIDTLKGLIREVPDFPKAGINFYDITTMLKDPAGLKLSVELLTEKLSGKGIEKIVAMESRGFIFASALAYRSGAAFVPVRKAGKLPWAVAREVYDLEYGSDKLEIHRDAIHPGERILIVDDVLATGGTASATAKLVDTLGGDVVGLAFTIELVDLNGRSRLGERPVTSLLQY